MADLGSQGKRCQVPSNSYSWHRRLPSSFCIPHFADKETEFQRGEVMHWRPSVQLCPILCTPWTAARQASLSITNSWSLLKLMSIKSIMPLLEAIILANTSRTSTRSQGLQCGSPALSLLQMTWQACVLNTKFI